jgi:hypothetical protein
LREAGSIALELSLWARFQEFGEIFLSAFLAGALASLVWGFLHNAKNTSWRQGVLLPSFLFAWLYLTHQIYFPSGSNYLLAVKSGAVLGGSFVVTFEL